MLSCFNEAVAKADEIISSTADAVLKGSHGSLI